MSTNNFGLGLQNLHSVLNEFSIINANLVGTNRTGYKGSDHYYGGSGAQTINSNLQIPDTNLTTSHTAIDFSQGSIVNSDSKSHLAINGDGFFLVQQAQDVGVVQPNLATRDGEFRFSNIPALGGSVLTTNNGLVVLRDASGTGAGPYAPILESNFDNNHDRPTVVDLNVSKDSLEFSKMGATVFQFNGTFQPSTTAVVVDNALEASNTDMKESLVAMSLNSKKFAAMAAQLKVEQNNLDIVTNLIKS